MANTTLRPPRTSTARRDLDLEIARTIDAPRERVFDAWTRRLPEWWGPHGVVTVLCELDLRPGGAFRTLMRAPDGTEYRTRGVFLEITRPERVVFTDAYDPGWNPHPDLFFTAIVRFVATADDRTICAVRALHWSESAREAHERMGFHHGWGESLERLAAVVEKS